MWAVFLVEKDSVEGPERGRRSGESQCQPFVGDGTWHVEGEEETALLKFHCGRLHFPCSKNRTNWTKPL